MIERVCEKLSIAYAHHLDFQRCAEFADLFAQDGILDVNGEVAGREAIAKAMHSRSPKIHSRHVLTNILIDVIDHAKARGISYLSLYRHIGEESLNDKVIAMSATSAVGHYSDEFVPTNEGWRFAKRSLSLAFRDPTAFELPSRGC